MKVEVYSDIACPWCYIGKHRFERALSAFPGAADVEVVYRPYQLDPGAPSVASSHRAYLDSRFGPGSAQMDARVAKLGLDEGIAFDFENALHVNTLTGHRLLRLAETEYGPAVQVALKEKLFAARFAEGGDVGDRAQLTELAVAVGMDRERVAGYLDSREGTEEVLAQIARAQELGVSSVPTFVFEGQWAVSGAQESSTFLRVLEQVREETRLGAGAESAGADGDQGDRDGDEGACADGVCAV
jgi:predicted DsbA family dithiol-disulfide isomerase